VRWRCHDMQEPISLIFDRISQEFRLSVVCTCRRPRLDFTDNSSPPAKAEVSPKALLMQEPTNLSHLSTWHDLPITPGRRAVQPCTLIAPARKISGAGAIALASGRTWQGETGSRSGPRR